MATHLIEPGTSVVVVIPASEISEEAMGVLREKFQAGGAEVLIVYSNTATRIDIIEVLAEPDDGSVPMDATDRARAAYLERQQ